MTETFRVRRAELADAAAIARVHVIGWQETYRGQIPDEVLDAPDLVDRRTDLWRRELTDAASAVFVAVTRSDDVLGFASAGPSRDDDLALTELYAIYTLSSVYGSGVGQQLLDAALGASPAFLWVAADNPRAHAFYARNGFHADGVVKNDGIDEVRMVRAGSAG